MSNRPSEPSILTQVTPERVYVEASDPPIVTASLLEPPVAQTTDVVSPNVGETVGAPAIFGSLVKAQLIDEGSTQTLVSRKPTGLHGWWLWPIKLAGGAWNVACMMLLLAVVAAVPLVQLASLGYLLYGAGRLAAGRPWSEAFPGVRLAGKLGTFAAWVAVTWLPVYLLAGLAYDAQLLQPGSRTAGAWRLGSFVIAVAWTVHVGWAAMRGGRWWHLLWPAPIKFLKTIWRPSAWSRASDQLYELWCRLKFTKLWWLGARASAGAILWTCVPVSLMILGQRAQELKLAGLVGLVGALGMTIVMLYLPLLQIRMASRNRFIEIFNVRAIRRDFKKAPWFFAISLLLLCALAIPLYLMRIEATPSELAWLPSLVFVLFMWPAKLVMGAAVGYANRRPANRHWILRWSAWTVAVASVLVYVGALYIAQFVAWQGAFVNYFQHAVLVPPPLISN